MLSTLKMCITTDEQGHTSNKDNCGEMKLRSTLMYQHAIHTYLFARRTIKFEFRCMQ